MVKANKPPATDHHIHPTLSALTGSDVTLTGLKLDGTRYCRVLDNVSFTPRPNGIFVIGHDDVSGGIRQFSLAGVQEMRLSGGRTFRKSEVMSMLDDALHLLSKEGI